MRGNTVNVRLGEERATICKQLKRGILSVESERGDPDADIRRAETT